MVTVQHLESVQKWRRGLRALPLSAQELLCALWWPHAARRLSSPGPGCPAVTHTPGPVLFLALGKGCVNSLSKLFGVRTHVSASPVAPLLSLPCPQLLGLKGWEERPSGIGVPCVAPLSAARTFPGSSQAGPSTPGLHG